MKKAIMCIYAQCSMKARKIISDEDKSAEPGVAFRRSADDRRDHSSEIPLLPILLLLIDGNDDQMSHCILEVSNLHFDCRAGEYNSD